MAISTIPAAGLSSGVPTRAQLPAGSVLQVTQSLLSSWTTSTSLTPVAVGLSASITPTSTSSKVMVTINCNGMYNGSSSNTIWLYLYKNGSLLSYLDSYLLANTSGGVGASGAYTYIDSPNTTSATTYALYWNCNSATTIGINNYPSPGTNNGKTVSMLTLTEIAG